MPWRKTGNEKSFDACLLHLIDFVFEGRGMIFLGGIEGGGLRKCLNEQYDNFIHFAHRFTMLQPTILTLLHPSLERPAMTKRLFSPHASPMSFTT